MRFGILWALAVWRNGEPVEVGGPRVRMLLALLLLDAGQHDQRQRAHGGAEHVDQPRPGVRWRC